MVHRDAAPTCGTRPRAFREFVPHDPAVLPLPSQSQCIRRLAAVTLHGFVRCRRIHRQLQHPGLRRNPSTRCASAAPRATPAERRPAAASCCATTARPAARSPARSRSSSCRTSSGPPSRPRAAAPTCCRSAPANSRSSSRRPRAGSCSPSAPASSTRPADTFSPIDNVPVSADYMVGPGDQLLIRAPGASIDVDFYRATVDPQRPDQPCRRWAPSPSRAPRPRTSRGTSAPRSAASTRTST